MYSMMSVIRVSHERDGSFTTDKGISWEMFDAGIAAQRPERAPGYCAGGL